MVLRLECTACKTKAQLALKRCKHFELGYVALPYFPFFRVDLWSGAEEEKGILVRELVSEETCYYVGAGQPAVSGSLLTILFLNSGDKKTKGAALVF